MGYFITIEGIEGAGKTTLRDGVAAYLRERGCGVVCTREPGGTEFGREIRKLILENRSLCSTSELLLFSADRAQHVEELIKPALSRNECVISDRYFHSTLAYQGYGRGLPLDELEFLCRLATSGLSPNLVLLLDLDPQRGLERAHSRAKQSKQKTGTTSSDDWNRFEEETLAFHRRIRDGFLTMAEQNKDTFVVLDATEKPEQVLTKAIAAVAKLFE